MSHFLKALIAAALLTNFGYASPRPIRIGVRHIENKGIGYQTGYTTLEGFLGMNGDMYVPFLDVRGHVFDNGKLAANAGLGVRALLGCRSYGLNAYYDYRDSKRNYNQVGVGIESLGSVWDFRANGYLPFGSKSIAFGNPKFVRFSGHNAYLCRKTEFAMSGFDAEFGGHINKVENFDFFIGAGPYCFFKREGGDNAIGGKLRLYSKYRDWLSLEVSGSYDSVFRTVVQGEIGISIPLGPRRCNECSPCCDIKFIRERLVQPVVRDEIIVCDQKCRTKLAIDPSTGEPYTFWFVDNTSSSLGTFESPYPTLLLAQTASGPNDIIYVLPGGNTAKGMNMGIVLQDGQQLLGASTIQHLPTTVGNLTIPALFGILPSITNQNPLGGDVVALANNNVISGFVIEVANVATGNGISQPNPGSTIANLTAINNIITGSNVNGDGHALELQNVTGNVLIANNNFNQSQSTIGVTVNIDGTGLSNTNYTIENNSALTNTFVNLNLTDSENVSTTISGNTVNANGPTVITMMSNATLGNANSISLTNNNITSFSDGIDINLLLDSNLNITLTDNQIYAAQNCVLFQFGDTSQSQTTFTNNFLVAGSNASAFACDLSGAAASSVTANYNQFQSLGNAFAVVLQTTTTATLSGSFSGNLFTNPGFAPDLYVLAANTSSSPNAISLDVSNNRFNGGFAGVFAIASMDAQIDMSILSNSFNSQTNSGIFISSSTNGLCKFKIQDNTIVSSLLSAMQINASGSATTCLSFINNTAVPAQNYSVGVPSAAFQIINTSANPFNVEPLTGNQGTLNATGITNVPIGTCN